MGDWFDEAATLRRKKDEERINNKARLAVAARSTSMEDCKLLLQALGLIETEEQDEQE